MYVYMKCNVKMQFNLLAVCLYICCPTFRLFRLFDKLDEAQLSDWVVVLLVLLSTQETGPVSVRLRELLSFISRKLAGVLFIDHTEPL